MLAATRSAEAQAVDARALASVQDYLAIEELIYRYAIMLDSLDAAGWADCMLPGKLTPEAVEKTMAFHKKYEYTRHHVLNHSYKVEGNTATGMHYSQVTYVKNTGGKLTKFDTYARYENMQLVKQGGRWYIAKGGWTPIFSTAEVPVEKEVPAGFWEGLK